MSRSNHVRKGRDGVVRRKSNADARLVALLDVVRDVGEKKIAQYEEQVPKKRRNATR